jgi:peptidoglycan/LPS O-acetylase OafA/YrhL
VNDLHSADKTNSDVDAVASVGTIAPAHTSTIASQRRFKSGYIKTLDGWRTIAVFSVIFYHARPITIGPFELKKLQAFGDRGVQLFFAISGILICSRLLEEQRLHGNISLTGFYIRRVFRIQPAAFIFLVAIGILAAIGMIHPTLPASLSALFCYRNFYAAAQLVPSPDDRYTAHFWSLAVEEHFYLLLPALLVFGRKRVVPLLTTLSVLFFIWPPIARHLGLAPSELSYWRTDMSLRNLLFPALLAILLMRPSFRSWMTRVSSYNLLIVLTIAAILVSQIVLGGHLGGEIICIGFPLMVISTMLHPSRWLGRFLESSPLVFLGRISYSLYLWQQLFFIERQDYSALRFVQNLPLNLIAVLICAVASYYFIEKPLMRLGHRLAPPATPGRPDLIGSSAA